MNLDNADVGCAPLFFVNVTFGVIAFFFAVAMYMHTIQEITPAEAGLVFVQPALAFVI